jgi:rubredoxin
MLVEMAASPGSYRCMACGLVFDSEDEAKRHEEQHPGMVRKAAGETAPS